jgi:hypothetical protein
MQPARLILATLLVLCACSNKENSMASDSDYLDLSSDRMELRPGPGSFFAAPA